jgi:hypothetical protein
MREAQLLAALNHCPSVPQALFQTQGASPSVSDRISSLVWIKAQTKN